ncbi:MAG: hypothetical protein AABY26_06865, partial [Nanoarchaeota archaeon]
KRCFCLMVVDKHKACLNVGIVIAVLVVGVILVYPSLAGRTVAGKAVFSDKLTLACEQSKQGFLSSSGARICSMSGFGLADDFKWINIAGGGCSNCVQNTLKNSCITSDLYKWTTSSKDLTLSWKVDEYFYKVGSVRVGCNNDKDGCITVSGVANPNGIIIDSNQLCLNNDWYKCDSSATSQKQGKFTCDGTAWVETLQIAPSVSGIQVGAGLQVTTTTEDCTNTKDDDGDGKTDAKDEDCVGKSCSTTNQNVGIQSSNVPTLNQGGTLINVEKYGCCPNNACLNGAGKCVAYDDVNVNYKDYLCSAKNDWGKCDSKGVNGVSSTPTAWKCTFL